MFLRSIEQQRFENLCSTVCGMQLQNLVTIETQHSTYLASFPGITTWERGYPPTKTILLYLTSGSPLHSKGTWERGYAVPNYCYSFLFSEEEVGYVGAKVELCVGGDGLISHELQELRS